RWWRSAVIEIDLHIGQVRQDEDLMLLRECHQILVEIEAGDVGRRIRWVGNDQRDRLRNRMDDRALHRLEELWRRLERHRANHTAGHQKSEGMDRIAWGL